MFWLFSLQDSFSPDDKVNTIFVEPGTLVPTRIMDSKEKKQEGTEQEEAGKGATNGDSVKIECMLNKVGGLAVVS